MALEDVVQQAAVARAQQDGVVGHVRVLAAGAEVPDEQAHRVARLVQAAVGPAMAVLAGQQVAVGPGRIGVGHHHVRGQAAAVGQANAAGGPVLDQDLAHALAAAHLTALPFDQAHQAADQAAGAAHREVHAELPLEEGDQAIDRGGAERVAAHQQRLEGEHHAQALVLHMLAGQLIDGAIALQPHQVGHHPGHVGPTVEGHMAELLEADPIDGLAGGQEALVAGHIRRRQPSHLGPHGLGVAAVVEQRAIVKAHPVEGRDRPQVHIVGQALAAQGPQFFKQEGRGDHRGAGIKSEAVLAMHPGPAARLGQLLQHRHPVAPGAQTHRSGQAAKAAADDHRMRPAIATGGGPPGSRLRGQRRCSGPGR